MRLLELGVEGISFKNFFGLALLTLSTMVAAQPAQAVLIIGPDEITASTDIDFNGGFGSIEQLTDGIGLDVDGSDGISPFNGYGPNAQEGTITFTLAHIYTITDFILANDINVQAEGVRTFQLSFYNSEDELISSTESMTALAGVVAPQIFNVGEIENVARIQLQIFDVYTDNVARIEIREVAFDGVQAVPEPTTYALIVMALSALGLLHCQKIRLTKKASKNRGNPQPEEDQGRSIP